MSDKAADVSPGETDSVASVRDDLATQIQELEGAVQSLSSLVSSLSARMLRDVDDLRGDVTLKADREEMAQLRKDVHRFRGKLMDVIDEVGFGESLDVAKVPPSILEPAYQAILDDITAQLVNALGQHDADQHIDRSLEQLRMKTSGSELFRHADLRIHVGIARPIEKGLVSPRQVQMTFDELLRHLLEALHAYTPKNFRAIVKIKSQEYAVHKALSLAREAERAAAQLKAVQERVDRLDGTVADALRDVQAFASRLQAAIADSASRAAVESLAERVSLLERLVGERPAPEDPEELVYAELNAEGRTVAALRRATGLSDGALAEALAALEACGRISSSVRGRSMVYRTKEEHDDA